MAPEQKDHPETVDHRADIYALGVVFYQMLTGELPGKKVEPPSSKVHIDVRLDEVVLRALEKKPELRYQQASVLKTQVETIATQMGNAGGKPGEESKPRNPKPELAAVEDWLALIDNGNFARSWETAANRFQQAITKEEWVGRLRDARQPVGQVISRKLRTARRLFSRLTVKFDTKYAGLKAAVETVTFSREGDGQWRAIGYLILPAYAEESLSPLMAMRRMLKKFLLIELPIAIVILLLIRTFFLQPFEAETDAAAPEIPRGSHVLVWKLTPTLRPATWLLTGRMAM